MKVRDIFLNPENIMSYQSEGRHDFKFNRDLELHMDLNEALSEATSEQIDAGGEYDSWLRSIGIQSNSPAGWWNKTAVSKDNMQAFVDYWHSEQGDAFVDDCLALQAKIKALPKTVRVELADGFINVREYVEASKEATNVAQVSEWLS